MGNKVELREGGAWGALPLVITTSFITALITSSLGIFGQHFVLQWQFDKEVKLSDHKKRQEVFSQLDGRRMMTLQLMYSLREAQIQYLYQEALERSQKTSKPFRDQEMQRLLKRQQDLVDNQFGKNLEALFATLASVRILFPNNPELEALLKQIDSVSTILAVAPPASSLSGAQLEDWRVHQGRQAKEALRPYIKPLDDLLAHLQTLLRREL